MKSIKHIALTAVLAASTFGTVLYTSCTKDKCKDVTCQNGGTCSDGNCTCTTGYEGTKCETASRAKFIKSWAATDVNTSTNAALAPYNAVIAASTSSSAITDVTIGNFSNGFFTNGVKATVSGNTITIASQQPDNDNYYVEGTGTYNTASNKITWTYKLTNPSNAQISYTGTWQ